jgi:hypothetical protein
VKSNHASFAPASFVLLIVQLLLVSTVVIAYAWQRQHYPRVWTHAYDYMGPQSDLRGRYLNIQVALDGCSSTLPSAKQALFPRDINGAAKSGPYTIQPVGVFQFSAMLQVQNGTLQAVYIQNEEQRHFGQFVYAQPGKPCQDMRLLNPINFYVPDNAPALFPLKPKQELWVELTIPPQGPPRPIQLALKSDGLWQPLAYH